MSVARKFLALEKELNARFFERKEAIRVAMLALATRQHMFLLGVPGTAKSELVNTLGTALGTQVFTYLFTRFTGPSEVFGSVCIEKVGHNGSTTVKTNKVDTTQMLPEARIAFLDEIFKANSAILNALLTILNERLYDNGGARQAVPLHSLFGASNETPEDEALAALYDRFLFRVLVTPIQSEANFLALLQGGGASGPLTTSLTDADLDAAVREVSAVTLSQDTLATILRIKKMVAEEKVLASDRRWKASVLAVKASAWLDGRTETTPEDCEVYAHILWSEERERTPVTKAVKFCANFAVSQAEVHIKEAREAVAAYNAVAATRNATARLQMTLELSQKLQAWHGQLVTLAGAAKGTSARKISKWAAEIETALTDLKEQAFKI